MDITNYMPVIVRYVIVTLATALATRGLIDGDQSAIITQSIDAISGAVIVIGTVIYALIKRPSTKALDAAKAIDKQIPAGDTVVIKTPAGQPDIVVSPPVGK